MMLSFLWQQAQHAITEIVCTCLPDNEYTLILNVCNALVTMSHAVSVGVCHVQVLWMDQTRKVP